MIVFPEHFNQDLLLEQVTLANEITLTFVPGVQPPFIFASSRSLEEKG